MGTALNCTTRSSCQTLAKIHYNYTLFKVFSRFAYRMHLDRAFYTMDPPPVGGRGQTNISSEHLPATDRVSCSAYSNLKSSWQMLTISDFSRSTTEPVFSAAVLLPIQSIMQWWATDNTPPSDATTVRHVMGGLLGGSWAVGRLLPFTWIT